jgi:hypothetical protein
MMGDLVLGDFDVVGDEDESYELGAARPSIVNRGRAMARKTVVPTPRWMRATTSQGVSRPQEELDYLPFVPASIAIGALIGVLEASPQRPFRPERVVMDAASAGVSAVSNVVLDPAIFVGAVQVGAAQGSAPIAVFSANAFGVRLSMPACGQGTNIRIPVRLLAAAAAITTVTAVLIGRAMR